MVFEENQGKIFLLFLKTNKPTRFFCGTMKNPAKQKFHLVFRKYNTAAKGVPKNYNKF